jgi:hypothetical protein
MLALGGFYTTLRCSLLLSPICAAARSGSVSLLARKPCQRIDVRVRGRRRCAERGFLEFPSLAVGTGPVTCRYATEKNPLYKPPGWNW